METYNWFVFYKDQILMAQQPDGYHIPTGEEPPVKIPVGSTVHSIGEMHGIRCKAYALHTPISGEEAPIRQMIGLRASYDLLPFEEYNMTSRCTHSSNVSPASRKPATSP